MADDDNLWAVAARQAHAQAAPAAPAGGAGGGKFEMSEEQLDSLVKRLEALDKRIYQAIDDAEPMRGVRPPGDDPHSDRVAQAMNASGDTYIDSLRNQRRCVDGMRRAMQKALDSYRGVESDNSDAVRQVSQGGAGLEGGI